MKLLFVTTVASTLNFFAGLTKELQKEGHEVELAANFHTEKQLLPRMRDCQCRQYDVPFSRDPFSKENLQAVKRIRDIIKKNCYDIVHCHTPVAALITRLACRTFRKDGLKVIYTAHGFHFYQGAPLKNWLVYYPIEKFSGRFTDVLITINQEDFEFAKAHIAAKKTVLVPGVGIPLEAIESTSVDVYDKRKELGLPSDAFVIASVGELNANKNQEVLIRALALVKQPKLHLAIIGRGEREAALRALSQELGVRSKVHFLGYREDVIAIYRCVNACALTSVREGLGVAALEGMACGLPLLCADNRGTRTYAKQSYNALICPYNRAEDFAKAMEALCCDETLCADLGKHAKATVRDYSLTIVNAQMKQIYKECQNAGV